MSSASLRPAQLKNPKIRRAYDVMRTWICDSPIFTIHGLYTAIAAVCSAILKLCFPVYVIRQNTTIVHMAEMEHTTTKQKSIVALAIRACVWVCDVRVWRWRKNNRFSFREKSLSCILQLFQNGLQFFVWLTDEKHERMNCGRCQRRLLRSAEHFNSSDEFIPSMRTYYCERWAHFYVCEIICFPYYKRIG